MNSNSENNNNKEDLTALKSKKYLNSIKKARKDYKKGKTFTHKQAFKDKNN